ncbi:MAG: queuosine salvage family protein [Solirubrobacteraceae bacterium]
MDLTTEVRESCAEIAGAARFVSIDETAFDRVEPGAGAATLDPAIHYLDGPADAVAGYLLALDAINFGSGWFPLLSKRSGLSGYGTIAAALADQVRQSGPLDGEVLLGMSSRRIAAILGQSAELELMALYAQALRSLGAFLGGRSALAVARGAPGAVGFARLLADGMAMFADRGFFKRAQIAAADLHLAGLVQWTDVDQLTIFADNLVPHVLRVDGVLRYDSQLAGLIDSGRMLRAGGPHEREIRACAVHACEGLARALEVPPRVLDNWLWSRGQLPRYKALARHRCQTVFY